MLLNDYKGFQEMEGQLEELVDPTDIGGAYKNVQYPLDNFI